VRNALRESGIEEFLPSYVEVVRWTDRVKNTPRVLFPSYLFARFARTTEGAAVLSITGVVQILGRDESDSISAGEIANLRRAASLSVSPCPYAAAGEIVTITSGPLTGMSGVVVRTDAALRLVISVEMFGKACSVRIDAADVEKATAS
jgi:transcription antitermination factor NusG